MAPPKRKGGGRVTPKGTKAADVPSAPHRPLAASEHARHATAASARYTPPTKVAKGPSPRWVPVLMFALLIVGTLVLVLNYLTLLPGATSNWYLPVGLGLILGGILTATQYR
jgi:hypothetical protein